MKLIISTLSIFLAMILLGGRAVSYQTGNRRGVIGLAWVEYRTDGSGKNGIAVKAGKETVNQVAPVVQQKTLGLYLDLSHNTPAVGLGFRGVVVVVPEINSETIVDYDTSDPLSSTLKVKKKESNENVNTLSK